MAAEDNFSSIIDRTYKLVFAWLSREHEEELLRELSRYKSVVWPPDAKMLKGTEESINNFVLVNSHESVLIESSIASGGQSARLIELALGALSEELDVVQKRYLSGLRFAPMRLYQVTRVTEGKSLGLVDELLPDTPLVTVLDRELSRRFKPGMHIGARVVDMATHKVFSRGYWPIQLQMLGGLRESIEAKLRETERKLREDGSLSEVIAGYWLATMLNGEPFIMPKNIVDAASGEPLVLITDQYQIEDQGELARRLDADPHAQRSGPFHWVASSVGETRGIDASIFLDEPSGELHVFYQTRRKAAGGKDWFEAVAGDAVRHLRRRTQEMSDLAKEIQADPDKFKEMRRASLEQFTPKDLRAIVEHMYAEQYADWADKALPALGGKTPREACKTREGQERVRGILSLYVRNEERLASNDGRRPVSLSFLWKQVGLKAN